jgi:hypothetical protein
MSTAVQPPLHLAEPREAADLAAFLTRLLRFDRAAAVRLQSAHGVLAVFARLPLGEAGPIVVRTTPLAGPAEGAPLDLTAAAGELLDLVGAAEVDGLLRLPTAITGPAWAGLLPPRGGWQRIDELETGPLAAAVRAAVGEFRRAAEATAVDERAGETQPAGGDAVAEAIWSRRVHPAGLTVRALHAAQLAGLLHQSRTVTLHQHPSWLRLAAPRGAVIVRRAPAPGLGLGLTPLR